MTREDGAWYRTFFDERYLRAYGPAPHSDLTERQAGEATALLGLEPPASILDLACGHGRHAIALGRRGFSVTGLDLSAASLERARNEARAAGVSVEWIEADMREIPLSPRGLRWPRVGPGGDEPWRGPNPTRHALNAPIPVLGSLPAIGAPR